MNANGTNSSPTRIRTRTRTDGAQARNLCVCVSESLRSVWCCGVCDKDDNNQLVLFSAV